MPLEVGLWHRPGLVFHTPISPTKVAQYEQNREAHKIQEQVGSQEQSERNQEKR